MADTKKRFLSILFLILVNILCFRVIYNYDLSQNVIHDAGDPCLNTAILEHGFKRISNFDFSNYFESNSIYPSRKALAFSEHLLGHQPFYFIIRTITGDALTSYNILSALNFFICSVGLFLFGYYLFKNPFPALFIAVSFTYSSPLIQQLGHFQISSLQWIGLIFLYLFKFLDSKKLKHAILLLVFLLLQSLSSFYIAYLIALAIIVVILVHLLTTKRYFDFKLWKGLSIIGIFYLVVMIPLAIPYLDVKEYYQFKRGLVQNVSFSAHFPISFITPSSLNQVFGFIYQEVHNVFSLREMHEKVLFVGFLSLFLLIYQWVTNRKENLINYKYTKVLAIIFFLLALGPVLNGWVIAGKVVIPLPYLLTYYVIPGFSSMRVPARFGLIFVLMISIIAAFGFKHLIDRFNKEKTKTILSVIILGLLVVELIPNIPMEKVEPVPLAIKSLSNKANIKKVAYYPFEKNKPFHLEGKYLYYSSYHSKSVINGSSGYKTKSNFYAKNMLNGIDNLNLIRNLYELGITHITVLPVFMNRDEKLKIGKALSNGYLRKIETYDDSSYLCSINESKLSLKKRESVSLKLRILDNRYLIISHSSVGGGLITYNRRDAFEEIDVEVFGSNQAMIKISKKVLIPAVLLKNNSIFSTVKLPVSVNLASLSKIIIRLNHLNQEITFNKNDIIRITSTNQALSDDTIKNIKLKSLQDNEMSFTTHSITSVKVKIINNSSQTIPALGEGNIIFSKDDLMIGLGLANSPGKYRIGFIGKWINAKGKVIVEHGYVSWMPYATWLSGDIKSKSITELDVNLKVPGKAGQYTLEIKMFQDLGFAKQGNKISNIKKKLGLLKRSVTVEQ